MGLALPLPGLIAPLLLLLESNDHHIGHTAVVAPASTSLIGNVVLASDGSGGATTATAAKRRYDSTWDLPNGSVRFDNPVRFPVDMTMTRDGMGWVASSEGNDAPSAATAASWIELWDPTFLGRYARLTTGMITDRRTNFVVGRSSKTNNTRARNRLVKLRYAFPHLTRRNIYHRAHAAAGAARSFRSRRAVRTHLRGRRMIIQPMVGESRSRSAGRGAPNRSGGSAAYCAIWRASRTWSAASAVPSNTRTRLDAR